MLIDVISGVTGAYLDISGKWGFPSWLWILLLGIAFITVPFIVFHKLRLKLDELQSELDGIKNTRPKIETKIRRQYNDFDIEVLNIGEYAEFETQIEVLEGNSFVLSLPSNYAGYWENTKNNKTELSKGKKDWLKIASLRIGSSSMVNYRLHYYKIASDFGSPSPMVTYTESTSWILGNNQVIRPCIMLKVTISSSPSMIGGAFIRIYKLSDNGLL